MGWEGGSIPGFRFYLYKIGTSRRALRALVKFLISFQIKSSAGNNNAWVMSLLEPDPKSRKIMITRFFPENILRNRESGNESRFQRPSSYVRSAPFKALGPYIENPGLDLRPLYDRIFAKWIPWTNYLCP